MPDPETGEMLWFNPDPRTIIPLDHFHISSSLRRTMRKGHFVISFDKDFPGVIDGCADRPTTWITSDIRKAYTTLFELGVCHSVEVWDKRGQLVGGLYGLAQGGVFNAESMFSRATDASKIALWSLIQRMKECGLTTLEVQFMTEHLRRLGAVEISRSSYLRQLGVALEKKVSFAPPAGPYNLLELKR